MGKQNFITIQLLAISGILISILISMIAFHQFALPSSKADLSTQVAATPPYLRVEKRSVKVVDGKKMLEVEVLANTNGMTSTGADVVLQYDPTVVTLADQNVHSTGVFKVININSNADGVLDFSLFSEKTRGEPLLFTNADQEIAIATIEFEVINTSISLIQLDLKFTPDSLEDTNLIMSVDPRPETAVDILKSVQPAFISL